MDDALAQRQAEWNLSDRIVRLFVSSTFRDCVGEREVLQKRIVPKLQRWCRQLRPEPVGLSALDLRWGITEGQVRSGHVVSICLEQISRCRPFFLGILTDRYGWHDPGAGLCQKPPSVTCAYHSGGDTLLAKSIERASVEHGWLTEMADRSVTELEIRHGALRHADLVRPYALFYLRSSDSDGEVCSSTTEEESHMAKKQLAALKDELRAANFQVRSYTTLSQFIELVEKDLMETILTAFPHSSLHTPEHTAALFGISQDERLLREALEHERLVHDAFCRQRARLFVPCGSLLEDVLTRLSSSEENRPLVVTGKPGAGKSTLLAKVSIEAQRHGHCVCKHFIGCTAASNGCNVVMRNILYQALHAGILPVGWQMPSASSDVAANFYQLLSDPTRFGTHSGDSLVVVIDNLNMVRQDGQEEVSNLLWLPVNVAPNVQLFTSTTHGPILTHLQMRNAWVIKEVQALTVSSRRTITHLFLADLGKQLSNAQVEKIVAVDQTSNPLFLHCLLKELCVCATFDMLDTLMVSYLAASNVRELFTLILARWEEDYEQARESRHLVRNVMSSICLSRHGMSEVELQVALGVPAVLLSPLISAAADSLFSHSSGCLAFSHADLRSACHARYLDHNHGLEEELRRRLVKFFMSDTCISEDRRAEELPYHLEQLCDCVQLKSYLSDVSVLRLLVQSATKYDLMRFWRLIGGYREAAHVYTSLLESLNSVKPSAKQSLLPLCSSQEDNLTREDDLTGAKIKAISLVSHFLWDIGVYDVALPLFEQVLAMRETTGNSPVDIAQALLDIANCHWKLGKDQPMSWQIGINFCESALDKLRPALQDDASQTAIAIQARSMHRLGWLHQCVGTGMDGGDVDTSVIQHQHMNEAKRWLKSAVNVWSKAGSRNRLVSLGALMEVHRALQEHAKALELGSAALIASQREFGEHHYETSKIHRNLGSLFLECGQLTSAEIHLGQTFKIRTELLGSEHVETLSAGRWLQKARTAKFQHRAMSFPSRRPQLLRSQFSQPSTSPT